MIFVGISANRDEYVQVCTNSSKIPGTLIRDIQF